MIVENTGYLDLDAVLKLEKFSIYETHKKTYILVKGSDTTIFQNEVNFYLPKYDRLPWKVIEGKRICSGIKVFDSKIDQISSIDTSKWNGGNQIMSYDEFSV